MALQDKARRATLSTSSCVQTRADVNTGQTVSADLRDSRLVIAVFQTVDDESQLARSSGVISVKNVHIFRARSGYFKGIEIAPVI
jgi:hypothetical protein